MSVAYTDEEAANFVAVNGSLKVVGGPIPNPNTWWGNIATLADYVDAKYPPYGVIVRPYSGDQILVWFDASDRLHVINVTGDPIAREVPKAPYEAPDSSLIESVQNRMRELMDAIGRNVPSPSTAFSGLVTIAVALAVAQVAGIFRRR